MAGSAIAPPPQATGVLAPTGNGSGSLPVPESAPLLARSPFGLLRVGVIFGGRSAEREVSLASGRQVFYHLDPVRFSPLSVFMDSDGGLWTVPEKLVIQNTCADVEARLASEAEPVGIERLAALIDVAFIALHGKYGDDGCIQGALELADIPYTGSGVLPCAVSLDKPTAHALMAAGGFDVPREVVVDEDGWAADDSQWTVRVADSVGLPCVVLPAREGSSLGVTVVEQASDLGPALSRAFAFDRRALVEEHLTGLEFSVIVLGNDAPRALMPTEIVTDNPIMTYDDKYMPGRSQKITPARVDPETLARIRTTAENLYAWLGFRGYARLDGFLVDSERIVFSDPNSTCGLAPSSFMFHQAAEEGMGPTDLVSRIVDLALDAHASKKGPLA
jgi:D-alanine-D-alanine ligase